MSLAEKYGIDLSFEHKTACPRCRRNGNDKTGDNLRVYGEGRGAFCWSCHFTIPSEDHKDRMGWNDQEEDEDDEVTTREPITPEENEQIKSITTWQGQDWRGIRDETNKKFGVRYEIDTETGEPCKQLVPTTIDGGLVGYKVRKFPKDFGSPIGVVGKECDLIGQFLFKTFTKTVLIVGGEVDQLSAYQMLNDSVQESNSRKGTTYETPAVVCPTIGESGAFKQIQAQYEWFCQFQKIILCFDNDEAGAGATEKFVEELTKKLPVGRIFLMKMRMKDPNEYLKAGKEREFVQDFWNAKPYTPAGVKTAADAFDDIPEELNRDRITLPKYMHRLQAMMGGGIRQGRIMNVIADTSVGKTTHVRRMVYHWIFNSPVTPTIVSLEDTAAQYMLDMISVHIEENMSWRRTEAQIKEWLDTEEGQRVRHELCFKEDGTPRFYMIDERGGTIKHIEEQMNIMLKKHDSRLFVIDVLTDLLRGTNAEMAEDHMNFQKAFIKDGATIVNVHHTRKPSGQSNSSGGKKDEEPKPRKATEYDTLGTGSFVQSGAYNVVLNRDKLNSDPLVRNTTEVDLPKCRGGLTGNAGGWYYDFDKAKCHDFDDWARSNGPKNF